VRELESCDKMIIMKKQLKITVIIIITVNSAFFCKRTPNALRVLA